MTSSIRSPLPFQKPHIKNAKLVELEIILFLQNFVYNYTNPLPFENEHHTLETIPLIREHLDSYLSILNINLQLLRQNIHHSKLHFLNKQSPQVEHTEEQLTQ